MEQNRIHDLYKEGRYNAQKSVAITPEQARLESENYLDDFDKIVRNLNRCLVDMVRDQFTHPNPCAYFHFPTTGLQFDLTGADPQVIKRIVRMYRSARWAVCHWPDNPNDKMD